MTKVLKYRTQAWLGSMAQFDDIYDDPAVTRQINPKEFMFRITSTTGSGQIKRKKHSDENN